MLGIWVAPGRGRLGEGAKAWARAFAQMRNSLEDILIVCCDGLGEEITATWPEATVQTCMVHLCRAQGLVVSQTG